MNTEMIGIYRIALLPRADEAAFVKHMTKVVFENPSALQLTRVTSGFKHQLLKLSGDTKQYAWMATVSLMEPHYDFAQHDQVQKQVEKFGVLCGLDVYTLVGASER